MPVVIALKNDNLDESHMNEIRELVQKDFVINENFTLDDLLALKLNEYQEDIQAISTQATQETILTGHAVKAVWKEQYFTLKPYQPTNDIKEMYILDDVDDIFAQLDESLATVSNILGSRYCKRIRP
eukprot:CAMPEP_0115028668 /NCGR_PEP_ID=MMETSP0216-20121206/36472_1 /TAXON_ID=223996 /ORGANISM="Protocruzia adherens, Strain Boccale" /LENGTH=126 /DNA_ID=CAMNT_0002404965 /DNA_START=277 /DNA_END=653 /DNA_ORIENTATION=+